MTDDVERARRRAKYAVDRALRRGELTRPDTCERCGGPPDGGRLSALHLNGYGPPHELDVVFWCRACVVTARSGRAGALTDADRRRYAELLDEVCAELRFRLRAAGLRQTSRDWLADRYVPQRALVGVLCDLLDASNVVEPDRRDLDVLFRAIEVLDRYASVVAPGGGGT